jgi:hypothetical protein
MVIIIIVFVVVIVKRKRRRRSARAQISRRRPRARAALPNKEFSFDKTNPLYGGSNHGMGDQTLHYDGRPCDESDSDTYGLQGESEYGTMSGARGSDALYATPPRPPPHRSHGVHVGRGPAVANAAFDPLALHGQAPRGTVVTLARTGDEPTYTKIVPRAERGAAAAGESQPPPVLQPRGNSGGSSGGGVAAMSRSTDHHTPLPTVQEVDDDSSPEKPLGGNDAVGILYSALISSDEGPGESDPYPMATATNMKGSDPTHANVQPPKLPSVRGKNVLTRDDDDDVWEDGPGVGRKDSLLESEEETDRQVREAMEQRLRSDAGAAGWFSTLERARRAASIDDDESPPSVLVDDGQAMPSTEPPPPVYVEDAQKAMLPSEPRPRVHVEEDNEYNVEDHQPPSMQFEEDNDDNVDDDEPRTPLSKPPSVHVS